MTFSKTRLLTLITIFLMLPFWVQASDYVIGVNHSNELETVTKSELKAIFLGDQFFWKNGKKVLPARVETDASFKAFLTDVVEMSIDNFNTYWRRRLFSGKALPPKKFSQLTLLVEYLSKETYAVSPLPPGVIQDYPQLKVLKILE